MLPEKYKPDSTYDLIRLGRNNDGGYLVERQSVLNAKTLLGLGIDHDWTFEEDFIKIKNVSLRAFDHTVNSRILVRDVINSMFGLLNIWKFSSKIRSVYQAISLLISFHKFFKENRIIYPIKIGYDDKNTKSLKTIFSGEDIVFPAFIKCDIEGSEYRILDDIIKYQDSICGLVIEFHDIDLHISRILDFMDKFSLTLVHIHPNNYGGVDDKGDPIVVEMTFSKNPVKKNPGTSIPNLLDQPNNPDIRDIEVKFQ